MSNLDINVQDHGRIYVMLPVSAAGREWLELHMPDDAQR